MQSTVEEIANPRYKKGNCMQHLAKNRIYACKDGQLISMMGPGCLCVSSDKVLEILHVGGLCAILWRV